jgi:hypothetical protein
VKLPDALALRLSPLVEAARGEPLVEPFVEVVDYNEQRLLLRSSYGEFEFDRSRAVVCRQGVEVADFRSIRSVDLAAFPGGRGQRSWSATLYRSFLDRITVARSYDDGEISVLGARLSRVIGCRVISLFGRR